MQTTFTALVLGALLAGCTSEPEPDIHYPPPPPSAFVPASAVDPANRAGPDSCTAWLDPVTKNTDLVQSFYDLDAAGARDASGAIAAVEAEKARLDRAWGVDKIVVTIPLASTYDARAGLARIPTDPAQGDSLFFDTGARGASNSLGGYTLATDPTAPVNVGSYPASNDAGPPTQGRISKGFRYGLALVDVDPRSGATWASAKGGLEVPLTPAQAHKGYGRLSVKIVAELVPPGLLTGREIHPATAASGGWDVDLRYLAGRTECAAIVTASDGEPVKRLR